MRADVGKELNLSVVAGAGSVVRLRPLDADESRVETAGKSFYAELRTVGGDKKAGSVGVTYSKERDVVLTLPEMGVGQYMLVVEMSASSGARERFVSGWVTYMEPSALVKPKVDSSPDRLIGVVMDGERRRAVWYHTTAAEVYAERAEKAAETAERVQGEIEAVLNEAVEEATERAEAAADRAEVAAGNAEKEADEAKKHSTLAEELKNDLRNRLLNMIKVIDGYLWIDGVPTDNYVKGTDGLQVYISSDGHWYLSDGTYLGWPATGADGITPHITADGYWAFGDEVTNYKAVGRDGIDGNSVRRLLVDSYEDIPQEGETCNGGYYYYVKYGKKTTGGYTTPVYLHINDWVNTYAEKVGDFALGYIPPNGTMDTLFGSVIGGTPQETANRINEWGITGLTAEQYDENTVVMRHQYDEFSLLVSDGDIYVGTGTDHNIYAWLEDKEGVGSWVHVGIANDVATAEVLGLVKLGTDTPVTSGAPVGTNMKGQMHVGLSTVTDNGTGKISVSGTLDADSGGIGRNANGQYVARKADNNNFGTVRYSRTDENARLIAVGRVPDGTKVDGQDRGGSLGLTRADANTYGGCKVPGAFSSEDHDRAFLANFNYVVPICMRDDTGEDHVNDSVKSENSDTWYYGANGHLIIALKQGGALQWESHGEANRDGVRFSTKGLLRLKTTGSFNQSENNGLTLNPASANLLGGVFRQETLASGTAVPTGSAVLNYLNSYYYTKGNLYTKDELTKDGGVIELELKEKLPIYAAKELQPYAKTDWVQANFGSKTEVNQLKADVLDAKSDVAANTNSISAFQSELNGLKAEVQEMLQGYVKVGNSGIYELCELTQDEFDKLPTIDTKKSYIVLANG